MFCWSEDTQAARVTSNCPIIRRRCGRRREYTSHDHETLTVATGASKLEKFMETLDVYRQPTAARFLIVIDLVLVAVTGTYGFLNLRSGYPLIGASQAATAIAAVVALVLASRSVQQHQPAIVSRRLTLVATVALAIVLATEGGGVTDIEPYMYLVPVAVVLLATHRSAWIINLGFVTLLAVGLRRPDLLAWTRGTTAAHRLTLAVAYTSLNMFLYMVSALRHQAYERLLSLARHDLVTGLPRFDAEASPPGTRYVALIQLLDTETIRLQGGRHVVNGVMRVVAERLSDHRSPACGLYAYTETGVLATPALSDDDQWSAWVTSVVDLLSRPVEVDGRRIWPRLSVYVVPEAASLDAPEIIQRMEATIQANPGSDARVYFYSEASERALRSRIEIADFLREALNREELSLAYQPLVDAIDESIVGAEVLMRWHNPELGHISPAIFIPIAEEMGLIRELTVWMIARAWRETQADPEHRYRTLSVNISPIHIGQPDFVERLEALVVKEGLVPSRVSLELTEGVLLRNSRELMKVVDRLRQIGFSLSIDDFGTGYSNLSYLRELAINRIKIDRSFVVDLIMKDGTVNSRATPLLEAMMFMAQTLGITPLVEGIETQQQAEVLRNLGCELFQGYLYGRPEPLAARGEEADASTEGSA